MSEFSQKGELDDPDQPFIRRSLDKNLSSILDLTNSDFENLIALSTPNTPTHEVLAARDELQRYLIMCLDQFNFTRGTRLEVSGNGYIAIEEDDEFNKYEINSGLAIRGTIIERGIDLMPVETVDTRDEDLLMPTPYVEIMNCYVVDTGLSKCIKVFGKFRVPLSHAGLMFNAIISNDVFASIKTDQDILEDGFHTSMPVVGVAPDRKTYVFYDQNDQLVEATCTMNAEVDEQNFASNIDARQYIPENGIDHFDQLCLFGVNELLGAGTIYQLSSTDIVYGEVIQITPRKDNYTEDTPHDKAMPYQFVYTLVDIVVAHEDGSSSTYPNEALSIKIDASTTECFLLRPLSLDSAYSNN